MRHSANLNIIVKAIEKASFKVSRDFFELEILQSNPTSAVKFANASFQRIKDVLAQDLSKIRPNYNIVFSDKQEIINDASADYHYVIHAIDGLNNLSRSLADCSIAISLQHKNQDSSTNTVAIAIYKIIGGDLFYAEKGFGAFLNNRKIRVSKRNPQDSLLGCFENSEIFEKAKNKLELQNILTRNYGCKTLEIAYLSSGKIDLCAFSKNNLEFIKPFMLLLEEAGGKIIENEDFMILSNAVF